MQLSNHQQHNKSAAPYQHPTSSVSFFPGNHAEYAFPSHAHPLRLKALLNVSLDLSPRSPPGEPS
eukprot:602954-Hanusia_phi.AAC.1